MSPALSALQQRFQDGLVATADDVLADIADSPREGRETLFGVYRHAYSARLIEALAGDYERLALFMGGPAFDRLGRAYVAENPSQYRSIRWFGDRLSAFIKTHAPWSGSAELAELAEIERALNDAFDAPDDVALTRMALGTVAPDDWPHLGFAFHPSVRRLDLHTNAREIWAAIGADEDVPPVRHLEDGPEAVLVWRRDYMSRISALAEDEAMLFDEAAAGVPFGVLCEMLATVMDADLAPARAATIVAGWLEEGLLTGFRVGASGDF